ncbi:glycosyltransferase family 1 protein [uncultured Duncaniella sp.]|uniref:glycosyltransferase family 4 protein n=1 Tax=uncultured Duncaniella sp. TaxID=2768039 RepID=UPI0026337E8C|nr:glycosyltransferase family 1 protein [uncultured Duncaniella sp.]
MNILYDSHTFSEQTFGGISRYFVELINHLPPECRPHIPLIASENEYLKLLEEKKSAISLRHFPEHRKLYYFINGFADRHALRTKSYDIFHPTGYDPYFIGKTKSPVVVTVHDMIYHEGLISGKHTSEIIENMRKTTLAADRIIAISDATKRAILRFYDIDESKIDVIHHGFTPVSGNTEKLGYCPERYLLFVGQRGGYKNFATLLKAFSKIAQKDKTLNLMCTGRAFSKAENNRIAELGLSGRCHHHFIPTEDMNALYANAECFIFPSKMEGFGMPILEAFAARCPAVISETSCFPEIAGDGGIYFNPENPDELAEKIMLTINNLCFRRKKIEDGERELKRFSWSKTGNETAETYSKVLQGI